MELIEIMIQENFEQIIVTVFFSGADVDKQKTAYTLSGLTFFLQISIELCQRL